MKRSGSSSLRLSPTGSPSRCLSPTGSPSHRLSSSPFNRSSEATSASHARDWVPPRDSQHFAHMFTKALWGHIHGTLLPCSDAANIDLPPPRSDTANIDPQSLVSGLPIVGGGSPANFQPPLPSPPRKLMFTVTLPTGEFDSDSDSDSQVDTDLSEDHFHGYIPPVPQGDALRVF
jgi:hypothetical protein